MSKTAAELESELQLCRELRDQLVSARAAYAARDLEGIYRHITAQATLCVQLRRIRENNAAAVPSGTEKTEAQRLLAELAAVEREIRNLNTEQMVFVNGSRRTINMIVNALANSSATYPRPEVLSTLPPGGGEL